MSLKQCWIDVRARLAALFGRREIYLRTDEELQFHLARLEQRLIESGVLPAEARVQARRQLGNPTLIKEQALDAWRYTFVDTLTQDFRYAVHTLRNNPGFAATAVLSLALGFGANTAIFSLIDAVMLRWLPVRAPQDLVLLVSSADGQASDAFSNSIFRGLAGQSEVFSAMCGYGTAMPFTVGPPEATENVTGAVVSGTFHETLGITPLLGRLFNSADDQPGAEPVVVITDGYWMRRFGRAPEAVGTSILLQGSPVTIIGVTPPAFVGATVGETAELTLPLATVRQISPEIARTLLNNNPAWMRILGRLRPGISPAQANARLEVEWPNVVRAIIPTPSRGQDRMLARTLRVVPGGTGTSALRGQFGRPLQALMVLVCLVLMIACANVANLLLFRAAGRQHEIALRLAIGASRRRLIRQLLTESTTLAMFGGVLGLILAWFGGRAIVGLLAPAYPNGLLLDLTPNRHVLAYTVAIASAASIVFGIIPALRSTRDAPVNFGHSRVTASRPWLMSVLVTAQVGLSLVLLTGAGLFVRTWQNIDNLDPGFRHEGVLLVEVDGRRAGYSGARLTEFYTELQQRFESLPGAVSAGFSWNTPLSGALGSVDIRFLDHEWQPGDTAIPNFVSAGFFETMQTPVIDGREFNASDLRPGSPHVVVVNEAFVKRYFPGGRALGQRFSHAGGLPEYAEIVGIVRDARARDLRQAPPPSVYIPYTPNRTVTFEVRVSGSLSQVSTALQQQLRQRFPGAPVEVRALTEQVERSLVQERLMATLGSAFGLLALVLASIGLYGLLAYGVASRTKEIGICMALGANSREVLRSVMLRAFSFVGIGVILGVPVVWAFARLVESLLFGLEPTDGATFVGAVIVLITTALVAAYVPARRAAGIDPMNALRHE